MRFQQMTQDAKFLMHLHAYLTIAWILVIPLSFLLRDSLIWVVFMSHYAIVVGHWSSWQATRTEVKQDA